MKRLIILFLFLTSAVAYSYAQKVLQIAEGLDYSKLLLPPLEELFENAKRSPSVEMFESKMMEQDNLLKSEKRSWMKYFKVGGSW